MHFEETKTNTPVTGFLSLLIIFEQLKAETLKNLANEKKKIFWKPYYVIIVKNNIQIARYSEIISH